MLDVYLNTFHGLIGANFTYAPADGEEGVALHFTVAAPVVYNHIYSFDHVARIVRDAKLDWIEPRSGPWLIDLDKLSALLNKSRELQLSNRWGWFKGWARIYPKLALKKYIPPVFPSQAHLPASLEGYVTFLIRPEDVMTDPKSVSTFLSYAREDEGFKKLLETHLSSLRREGRITHWDDRKITAGNEWRAEIEKQLDAARLIILMISAYFIESEFCFSIELKRALERHESGEARVVPIIVRPCDWKNSLVSKLQALPTDGKPITTWTPRDMAYVNIVEGLRKVIDEMTA